MLKLLEDESVDMCVTSPPYYGMRDYGTGTWLGGDPNCPHRRLSKYTGRENTGHHQIELAGNVGDAIYKTVCPLCGAVREDKQIGLEESPELYVQRLAGVFREVRRVLKKDGTLWLNIGDSYAGSGNGRNPDGTPNVTDGSINSTNQGSIVGLIPKRNDGVAKPKDLIGIPWMLAFALRDDGWYLRQDIIWHKPNPMPESVKDRCTKSHEYLFLLSKSDRYFYNFQAVQEESVQDLMRYKKMPFKADSDDVPSMRNKRDVWTVPVQPTKEAHFATFPEALIEPCILAGCREGWVVLDPFFGSGTTGRVAIKHGRGYIGIELNPQYIEIEKKRLNGVQTALF